MWSANITYTHSCGQAIEADGSDTELIIPRKGGLKDNKEKIYRLKIGNKKFLCFQDLYFLKQENPAEYKEVEDYLNSKILSF